MTLQQEHELRYWIEEVRRRGKNEYILARKTNDLPYKTKYYPEILSETGKGLDYGCALYSIFEGVGLNMDAYDPIVESYHEIMEFDKTIKYYSSTKELPNSSYDFIFCCNVIDHTPDPTSITDDIVRLMKPNGKLYFEVHFDPQLGYPCHSILWTEEVVSRYFTPDKFKLIRGEVFPGEYEGQRSYQAVYEVIK